MVIRHFKKQVQESSDSESSSSEQESTAARDDNYSLNPLNESELHLSTKANSDSDSGNGSPDSSSSSSSSSSDDEVTLHKPVFLKRKRKDEQNQPEETGENGSLVRAAYLAKALRQKQYTENIVASETSDQSILSQIIAIDDTDNTNPEQEQLQWEQRQQTRLKRERQKKLDKQLLIEEQEMQRASQLGKVDDPWLRESDFNDDSNLNSFDLKASSRNRHLVNSKKDISIPSRLQKGQLQLASSHTNNETEDTEYGYIEE
ncbi:Spp381 [Kluyveromyces lactis]|nr:Spp381 [Kluyveromyces lactis]